MDWPCRTIIVGGSNTGKTYLVSMMIKRGDFGGYNKKDLDIYVISPSEVSINQSIWKNLQRLGYKINKIHARGHVPIINNTKPGKKLIILDDVDKVYRVKFKEISGQAWLEDLFGIESHHSDMSIVLISHGISFGAPLIKTSAEYIILTEMEKDDVLKILKIINKEEYYSRIMNEFDNDEEAIVGKDGNVNTYNNIVIVRKVRKIMKDGETIRLPVLNRIAKHGWEEPKLIPLI